MKIFREETFGGVLYDDRTLSYRILFKPPEPLASIDRVIPLHFTPTRTDILSGPVRVYFELTRRCNLSCAHCFASSSPQQKEEMDRNTLFSLLLDLRKSGVINIRFTGGEPTARSDWYDIVDYAKKLEFVVSLSTNGVFRDCDTEISRIKEIMPEQVTLSIDGMEETHDRLRGKGTFRKTLSSLEELKKNRLNLRLTTVLTTTNTKEIPALVELASRYVKVINFVCIRPIGRATKAEHLMLDFHTHRESAMEIQRLKPLYPDLLIIHSDLPLPDLFITTDCTPGDPLTAASSFANTTMFIAADGSFWPHHYLSYQSERFRLGTWPECSVLNAWSHSEIFDGFHLWTAALLKRCTQCPQYTTKCAGTNFEMELARIEGHFPRNPYCIHRSPVPSPLDFIHEK